MSYALLTEPEIAGQLARSVGRTVILEGTVPQDADDVTPDNLQVTRLVGAGEPRVPQWHP